MHIKKIKWNETGKRMDSEQLNQLAKMIRRRLAMKGYNANVQVVNKSRIDIGGGITLTENFKKKFGRNLNGSSGWRTSNLGWDNYLVINYAINEMFTKYGISARITSLHNTFLIRDDMKEYRELHWEKSGWDNVGSMMYPVYRREHNVNENGYSFEDISKFEDVETALALAIGDAFEVD